MSEVGWFVAPFDGELVVGAAGGEVWFSTTVKLQTPDHALVPPAVVPFTSQ
jgi:hypothetical protein